MISTMLNDNDELRATANVSPGRRGPVWFAGLCLVLVVNGVAAAANAPAPADGWLTQPLSLVDSIRIALKQNNNILKSQSDLELAHGVAVQTRAIVMPKLRGSSGYEHTEAVEKDPTGSGKGFSPQKNQWSGSIRVVQSLYEGGRMTSALRSARLVKEQAFLEYQSVVADTLLVVRTAYYDALLAEQQILVQDASVKLLELELSNTTKRKEAGAVPQFNVLRAEVKVANALPKLIRAKNRHRIAKNNLATVLGYNIPTNVWDDIPLVLTSKLDPEPYDLELPGALGLAREHRPELGALRTEVSLQGEKVISAKSGYKPSLSVFGGYGAHNSEFSDDIREDVPGPMAGVAMSWDFWDGRATEGRVIEAKARESKAFLNLEDKTRRIDQEVRTAYSSFIEARQVLDSQKKVVERAEESIRLADSRYDAGSGTQLDVLDAQTSLTEARTTQVEAARDYLVARAQLERAIGLDVSQEPALTPRPEGAGGKP